MTLHSLHIHRKIFTVNKRVSVCSRCVHCAQVRVFWWHLVDLVYFTACYFTQVKEKGISLENHFHIEINTCFHFHFSDRNKSAVQWSHNLSFNIMGVWYFNRNAQFLNDFADWINLNQCKNKLIQFSALLHCAHAWKKTIMILTPVPGVCVALQLHHQTAEWRCVYLCRCVYGFFVCPPQKMAAEPERFVLLELELINTEQQSLLLKLLRRRKEKRHRRRRGVRREGEFSVFVRSPRSWPSGPIRVVVVCVGAIFSYGYFRYRSPLASD